MSFQPTYEELKPDEVEQLLDLAYRLGCKGVTVFRDGSRPGVLSKQEPARGEKQKRPRVLQGTTRAVETPLGRAYVTVNFADGAPFELFATIGKAGSDVAAFTEAVARLVSLALRSGVPAEQVIKQLRGIGGSNSVGFGAERVASVPDAIGKALKEAVAAKAGSSPSSCSDLCPSCGAATLVAGEGCHTCANCGYSAC